MGISSKWIKTLVGIKKHGKRRNSECTDTVRQRVFIELAHGAAFCYILNFGPCSHFSSLFMLQTELPLSLRGRMTFIVEVIF
jgi:hypothetical protein